MAHLKRRKMRYADLVDKGGNSLWALCSAEVGGREDLRGNGGRFSVDRRLEVDFDRD